MYLHWGSNILWKDSQSLFVPAISKSLYRWKKHLILTSQIKIVTRCEPSSHTEWKLSQSQRVWIIRLLLECFLHEKNWQMRLRYLTRALISCTGIQSPVWRAMCGNGINYEGLNLFNFMPCYRISSEFTLFVITCSLEASRMWNCWNSFAGSYEVILVVTMYQRLLTSLSAEFYLIPLCDILTYSAFFDWCFHQIRYLKKEKNTDICRFLLHLKTDIRSQVLTIDTNQYSNSECITGRYLLWQQSLTVSSNYLLIS